MGYRAALIGCGKIASEFADDPGLASAGICTHAQAYAATPEIQLVAVCDSDPAKLQRCGERWKVAARYRDAGRLLAEVRPDIVSVCTPDATHYRVVQAARALRLGNGLEAGVDMGPVAMRRQLDTINRLLAAGRDEGATLASGGHRPAGLERGFFIEPTIFGHVDNHSTIPANHDHHLPTRRCGSNRRLDLSGQDDPRKARLFALRADRLGPERASPCHQQRT